MSIARLACDGDGFETVVVVVSELFDAVGSDVALVTVAVFVMTAPSGVPPPTATTIVNTCGPASDASVALVNVTVPVPPGAGAAVDHPAGALAETNVVFAGVASETDTLAASPGPPFVTVTV
jgi:hypothetical protein